MKLKGKHVLLMIVFIVIVSLVYIIASTFSYTSLTFKPFFVSENLVQQDEYQHITYSLTKDNRIVFIEKNDNKYYLKKIKADNVDPITVTSIDATDVGYYDFFVKGKYAYFFYNDNNSVKIIDYDYYEVITIDALPEGLTVVNGYNDSLYSLKGNTLHELSINENNTDIIKTYTFSNDIKNIKYIDFIDENELVISTYESKLFVYNLNNNSSVLLSDYHSSFYIDNKTLYYTYSSDSDHITISSYKNGDKISFDIKACDYLTMKVKDNYMYLIGDDEINKVSIERKKRQDNMQMSSYENFSYNLSEILIVNEKLMYLPMIEYSNDNEENKYLYSYHLYRYKI